MASPAALQAEIARRLHAEELQRAELLALLGQVEVEAPPTPPPPGRRSFTDWLMGLETPAELPPQPPPAWAESKRTLPKASTAKIGPTPAPSWARTGLEWVTGYPADPLREMGPIETAIGMAGAVPLKGMAKVGKTLAEGGGNLIADAARALFPRLDNYGKPAGLLSRATMLKRIEGAGDLSPWAETGLRNLADHVGDRRIQPAELHALAAGQPYKPERVLRKVKAPVEGEKQIPGAPLGVTTARQERALREGYLSRMEEGVEGRDWYHDTGEDILFAANDDPERAMRVAEDLSATSSATAVSGNAGMGVKGYNQATAGVPIVAGRFPTAMGERIAEVHDPSGLGLRGPKQTPFAHNIARGGGFLPVEKDVAPRTVHDIWDAEARGYVNPDGTPVRRAFTPAEHRYMDEQDVKILAAANQRAIGGFTDWEELRSQAAAWVGAKVRSGEIDPTEAGKHFGDYFKKLYAQGSREFTPGETTRHLPELLLPENEQFRQLYHEMMLRESGVYDQQMRDQIAAGYGALVGPSFEGPGYFRGRTSPGMQTQVLTGSLEAPSGLPGARVMDEGSRRLMDASEATHGLLFGQDASAWSKLLPAGSGGERNVWDVMLEGGTLTPEQMQIVMKELDESKNLVPIPTPSGVRLTYPPGLSSRGASQQTGFKFMQEMPPDVKAATKRLGGTPSEAGNLETSFMPNHWQEQLVGQDLHEKIRLIGTDTFDQFVPGIARRVRNTDAEFRRMTGGRFTLSPVLDEVKGAISNEGWRGVERLAKKYGLPVMVLAAGLASLVEPQPAPESQ